MITELKVSAHLMTLDAGLFCVFTSPGAMQFTRTLSGPYSCARLRASCMSAALLMQ